MKKLIVLSTMVFLLYFLGSAWGAPPKGGEVPIGTVLDWWRPDDSWPVPDGYQICDGSVVTDDKSPLYNMAVPDLLYKFILGVTELNRIGMAGGSTTHDHTVDINHTHHPESVSSGGDHAHAVDLPLYNTTVSAAASGSHKHQWLDFQVVSSDDTKHFYTYDVNGNTELTSLWHDGIGDEGAGNYPFAVMYVANRTFYTLNAGEHNHGVSLSHDHSSVFSASSGPHTHSLALPPLGTRYQETSAGPNTPPYYGLLKIMRIR